MKLTLGFSPCPNDTFIFDAMVNHKIDTEGLDFDYCLEDVETLNDMAVHKKLDISKISYGVLAKIAKNYIVLSAGSALGKGVGPLLITLPGTTLKDIEKGIVAIPGEDTTAHMLFNLAYPGIHQKKFMLFSKIESSVKNKEVTAGVIIHEGRFTYENKGLSKMMDLGNYWEENLEVPIPLGGIVANRDLEPALIKKVNRLIRNSLQYAFKNYPEITNFTQENAQEMEPDVMKKHIDLYVNNYSLDLGPNGKKAVRTLLSIYEKTHRRNRINPDLPLFVD